MISRICRTDAVFEAGNSSSFIEKLPDLSYLPSICMVLKNLTYLRYFDFLLQPKAASFQIHLNWTPSYIFFKNVS